LDAAALDDVEEELEEFDGVLPCATCDWPEAAELPTPEPLADEPPTFCRTSEKFCDDDFADAELAEAAGAELGAIILSRIASVMYRAARA